MARILHTINVLLISWHFVSASPIIFERTQNEKTTLEKILLLRSNLDSRQAAKIAKAINRYCGRHLADLCISIIFVESSFRKHVVGRTGDCGLGQISPGLQVSMHLDSRKLLTDVDYNIEQTVKIIKSKKNWFYYHSRTKEFYVPYKRKVQEAWKKIQQEKE